EKHHHRPEAEDADVGQNDGPRKEEGNLEIEQDEQDGDQVIEDIELHPGVLESFEAAFVRRKLRGVRTVRGNQRSHRKQQQPDADADQDEKQDRKVLFQHDRIYTPSKCDGSPALPQCIARPALARLVTLVPTGRLELPRLTPLPPQDSVSTNFTTSAWSFRIRQTRFGRSPRASPPRAAISVFPPPSHSDRSSTC